MARSMRIKIDGTPFEVKVQAHRKDAALAVVKARDPQAARAFLMLVGVEAVASWEGPRYFAVAVAIERLPAGIRNLVTMAVDLDRAAQTPDSTPQLVAPGACVHCGLTEQKHWAQCPMHPENLS